MPALVPIPWQPHLYLTPRTLALLNRASTYYGDDLYLYDRDYKRISPAWRSYAQQLAAWRNYLAGTGPIASNPDSGQRNHMRGAAFDLRLTTARAQQSCRRAGLIRDSHESWHWNDPNWASMPVIRTRTTAASTGTAILRESDPFMPKVIKDVDTKKANNRYAVTDLGFTFDFITGTDAQISDRLERKKDIIGQKASFPLSGPAFAAELADVNANRAQAGLPEIVRPG